MDMTRRAWMFMGITASVWGASYMFIKIALDDGVTAPSIVFLRVVFGALVLVPLALRSGGFAGVREHRRWAAAVGMTQVALPFLLITYGERWIPSSLAAILVSAAAIFVVLLSPWLAQGDTLRGWGIVGIVLGMVGVALLFGVDLGDDPNAVLGGFMVLLAAALYAIASIWVRTKLPGVAPIGIAASTMIAAAIATLPAALLQPPEHLPSLGTWAALVALGVGGTGVAFLLYYTLIAEIGVSRASVVAYLAPMFAVTYGALFLDEAISVGTVGGLILILGGSYAAVEGRPPWQPRPAVEEADEPAAA
jgi:drug/metabolite transporter (DMT)-like permease